MPIMTKADVKIYDPRTRVNFRERTSQYTGIFNAGSGGTIRLASESKGGDFDYQAFWNQPSSPVRRRDPNSLAAVAAQKMTQNERVGVKLNRGFGPVATTFDALRKIEESIGENEDPTDVIMTMLGDYAADIVTQEKLNLGISALAAALRNTASLVHDASAGANGGADADNLNTAFYKRGDKQQEIVGLIAHSNVARKLTSGQITGNVTGIASMVMQGGTPATLNRPMFITDSPGLIIPGATPKYITLCLVKDALVLTDTEDEIFYGRPVTGQENLYIEAQGEYAYNLDILGHSWNVAGGGSNPTDAAIGTGTNWTNVLTDIVKNGPGIAMITQ